MARKSSLIENAQNYRAKGQFDKAVKEYQRALRLDPKDLRVRQRLGEVLALKGDRSEAVKELTVVAESYAKDGFFLKAVAVYKQLLKLKIDLWDVHLKLGELYQQLNLAPEAVEHYTYVAAFQEQNGRWVECHAVYERLVELNPTDLGNKIKLAELATRVDKKPQAVALLREVAEGFKAQGRKEQLTQVYERLLALSPQDLAVHKSLAEVYIDLGNFRKALAKLQVCFKADSSDVSTLQMLADVFYALEQMPKAKAVLKELARVHEYAGRQEQHRKTFERIALMDPTDADARRVLSLGSAPAAAPAAPAPRAQVTPTPQAPAVPPPTVPPPVQAPAPTMPSWDVGQSEADIQVTGELAVVSRQTARVMGEAHSLARAGNIDEATRMLKERVVEDPRSFRLHDRLRQALMDVDDIPGATRVSLMLVKLAVGARQVEPARQAAAIALALSPGDPTVTMLTSKLGVTEPATLRRAAPPPAVVPAPAPPAVDDDLVDDSDDSLVESLVEAALDEPEPEPEASAAPIDDGLVEDDGLAIPLDSLVDDEGAIDEALLAQALAEEGPDDAFDDSFDDGLVDDEPSLVDVHLTEEDESHTWVNVPSPVADAAHHGADFETYEGEIIEIEEDGSTAHLEVARAYLDMGLPADALDELTGLTLGAAGMWLMGRIQLALGEPTEALRWLQAAASEDGLSAADEAGVRFDLATAYEAAGDDYRALEAYRQLFAQHRDFRPREVRGRITQVTRRVQAAGGAPARR